MFHGITELYNVQEAGIYSEAYLDTTTGNATEIVAECEICSGADGPAA